MIGGRAEEPLTRGEALSGRHRNALRAGTVMTGSGTGALAAFSVINSEGEVGSSPSDEAIFGYFVAGGAALGVLTQVLLDSRLHSAPTRGGVGIGPRGRIGLFLSLALS
jgi:hypothetical protein